MPDTNFGNPFMANMSENPVHKIVVEVRNKAVPTRADVMQSKEGTFIAVPVEYDPNKDHAYKFAGPNQKKLLKEFGENFISVTQFGSIIEGIDDTSAINKINKILKSVGIEKAISGELKSVTEDMMNSIEKEVKRLSPERGREIEGIFKRVKNFRAADVYGNAFHRAIEILEREGSVGAPKDVEKALKKMLREKKAPTLYGSTLTDISGGDRSKNALIKDIDAYFKKKAELGLGNVAGAEQQLGAVVKIGNEIVKIAGTFDQLFLKTNYVLRDLKTSASKQPSPAYGLQLNLLEKLLNSVGISVAEKGITRVKKGEAFDYKIGNIDNKDLTKLMSLVVQIQNTKDVEQREALQSQARTLLGGGAVRTRVGKRGQQTTYNDMTLGDIQRYKYLNEDQKVDLVKNLFSGMSKKDQELFVSSLFNTNRYGKEGLAEPSNTFYRQGSFYDRLRKEIPNPYFGTASSRFEYKEFETEAGEKAGGAVYGGLFASQNAQKYRILLNKYGEKVANNFLEQMLKDIDAAIGSKTEDKFAYQEGEAAENFFRSLGLTEDKTPLNANFVKQIDVLSPKYRHISDFIQQETLGELGGQLQGISKEEQALMAQSASERRGVVANEKTWELLNSLKKMAEGPGGLFDIIKQMESDTAENMNSEEILSKYSDALYTLFSGLSNFKEIISKSIRNLGKVSEIDEFGNYLEENKSEQILDYVNAFYSNAENIIKNSQLDIATQQNLLNRLGYTRSVERDGSISHQIGYRLARGVGAYDYMNLILSGGLEKANVFAQEQGTAPLSPEQYAAFVLSPEAYSQYSLSKKFKESYLNKQNLPHFLEDFVSDSSYDKSAEFASLKKQIAEEFINPTTKMFEDTRIYVNEKGNLISGLNVVSDILAKQLSDVTGEFDLSGELQTLENNPEWAQRILQGKGIYRVEDIDEKMESVPQFYGTLFPEKSDDRAAIIRDKLKELQTESDQLVNLSEKEATEYGLERLGDRLLEISNESDKLSQELQTITSAESSKTKLLDEARKYLNEQTESYEQTVQAIRDNYEDVGNVLGVESHPEQFASPEAKRDFFLQTAKDNLLKATGGLTAQASDEEILARLLSNDGLSLSKRLARNLESYKTSEEKVGGLAGYSSEQVAAVRQMSEVAQRGYEYQQSQLQNIIAAQEEAAKVTAENAEKIAKIKERAETAKLKYEDAEVIIVPESEADQERRLARSDAAKKGWATRRKKQGITRGDDNVPTAPIATTGGTPSGPIHVIIDGTVQGDFKNKKTVMETWDPDGNLISFSTKDISKRSGTSRGTPQLDVIKQIKEDTGKIVDVMTGGSASGGGGTIFPPEGPHRDEDGSFENDGGRKKGAGKSLKSDYIKLLKERYDLLIKIDAIEEKMRRAEERGERTTGFKEDLKILQNAEKGTSEQMLSDRFAELAGNEDIQRAELVQKRRRESKRATLGLSGAEEQLAYFEKYAEKRIDLEAKIEDTTIKAQTAQTTNARKAFENLKTIYEGHLADTDEVFEKLSTIVKEKFPEQFDEINKRMEEQKALLFAQKAASNRGNRTIFDVIKSDIQHATMRITDFGLAARGLNAARKEIQQVYQNILKLNEAMTNLRVITGTGQAQAMEMMRTYNSLAKELGTTTQAVAQSAAEWLRQGYSVSETNKLIQSSTYLSRLGFMDMSQSVTALTSVMKGFRVEASNSMEIVDKLTQLDAKYATTAGDIATALSRTSAVAREAGLDLDQTAAALTTMIDISQQDASSVGNAFKTILARYGNVKAGVFSKMMGDSEDIDETNSAINDTEKVLNAIGIQVRSSSNDIRDFDEVFAELAEKYQYLSDVERAAVTTALGGVRQRNLLNILLNNYDQYIDAIEESQKAVGSAERKNQAYLKSTAYQISRMSAAWEDFTQKLDADEGVVEFFKLMSNLIEKIDRILPMVLTYVASIRAYKLPQLIPKLLGFMGFTTNEEGKTDVKGGFSRWGQFFTGQASGAQEQQSRKTLIFTIRDAIKAIRNNTAVKMGTKPPFGPSSGGGGRATGMTLNGKKVYQDSNGVWRYLNHRVVGDKDLQGIQTPSSKKEMSAEDQARLRRSQNIARTVATGVTAGVSIGLSTEGDTTDKVTKGLIGGVLGAGAGALNFVPYAGPILSTIATLLVPVLTDLIGDNLLKIIKQNEVARADRVKIANEQLEALNKITISTSEIMSLSKGDRGLWDADDWKTYNDYINNIESTAKASVAFADALKEAKVTLGEYTQENLRTIEATRIRVEADQKYAAGEEERYKLLKEIEENRKKLEGDEAETARSLIAAAQAEIEEFKKERQEGYLKAAFITSGVGSMSAANINAAALERVIMNIAEVWANDYPELFEEGYLTNDARSEIVSFLREQSGYESLLNQTARDVFELDSARKIVENAIKGTTLEGKSISELQKLVKEKGWTTLREIFSEDYNLTDFVDKLSSVDDDAISMIAHSLGMTVEEFQTANKQGAFNWLTKGDAINGAEKLADKMNALDDIIVDLAADGALTAENINKIVQNYKFLLRAPDGSIGIEKVLGNLATQLAAGADSPMMRAYVGRRIKELSEDQDVWALYTSSKKFEDRFKKDVEKYNNLLVAGSYSKALNILGDDDKAKQDFWDIASELAGIPDLFKQTQEKLIEFKVQEYDNEIQNLASIKDALADINKQREREIDLIKAKESLENAQKEFKSVYRAGIGWTYEVDQAAVESAQERVDELERQQTQEDLQYQIDILNQQKELLENISKNEELQNLQEIAKNFAGQVTANDLLAAILSINVPELREKAETGIRDEAVGRVDNSTKEANYKAFASAKEDYEKALQTLKDYYENNEAILEDTANPLYGTTKDEYARLYADAQTKRAAVLKASEAANAVYGAEIINRPDPNKYAEASIVAPYPHMSLDSLAEEAEGDDLIKHMEGKDRSKSDQYILVSYDNERKTWVRRPLRATTLKDAQAEMQDYDILINNWGDLWWRDRAIFKRGDRYYWANTDQGDIGYYGRLDNHQEYYMSDVGEAWRNIPDGGFRGGHKNGTLSFAGGRTLINENGLESIITPQGTITSLPAKSGILPADLTKNLWTLGEIAPNLIARLSGNNLQTTNSTSAIDNSISINKLDATFHTTQDFDGHQFITDLKNQVLLTANNH